MSEEHKLTVGNETFGLGLIKPDKIPLSFAAYPPEEVYSLADLKKIYANKNRRPMYDLYRRRKNQGPISSCCAYAATTACEISRLSKHKQDVELGSEWLYCLVNGGADRGALLDHAMRALLEKGCCLRSSVPERIWNTRKMSMEEKNHATREAKDYRALDWVKMPHGDVDACWASTISAIADRRPVLMAVHCGQGFFSANGEGQCRVDRGVGNHAVCGAELLGVESAGSLRDIKIWTANSHGKRYGWNGWYQHTYDHMCQPCQHHQHCAAISMRTSDEEKISTLIG